MYVLIYIYMYVYHTSYLSSYIYIYIYIYIYTTHPFILYPYICMWPTERATAACRRS
jgi:hypothetical protein